MSAKAELKAVLKLDNLQFVRSVKQSITLAKQMAVQFAKQPIRTTFIAGMLSARKAVQVTASAVEKMGTYAKRSLVGISIGAGIAAGGLLLISKHSADAAGQLEQYSRGFGVLLGSIEKGNARMKELVGFSNDKGLLLTNVADASQTLETLTKGALSTGKGLQFVGDVAAGTRRPLGEMALTIGRLYDAMRTGQSGGAELARLQEVGAISGMARRKIEALGSSGFGAEGWKLAQQELGKYNGMMDAMSSTWLRRVERFQDSIEELARSFGGPLIDKIGPSLQTLSNFVFSMSKNVEHLGEKFATSLQNGINFGLGVFTKPDLLIAPFKHGLKAAFLEAGNVFIYTLELGTHLIPTFISGMTGAFVGMQMVISGSLIQAFAKPLAYLQAGLEKTLDMLDDAKVNNPLDALTVRNAEKNAQRYAGEFAAANSKGDKVKAKEAWDNMQAWVKEGGEAAKRMKGNKGAESIESRAQRIMASGMIGNEGKEQVDIGKQTLKNEVANFFSNFAAAIKNVSMTDSLGAGAEMDKARRAASAAVQYGQGVANSVKPPPSSTSPAAATAGPMAGYFGDKSKMSGSKLGFSGGLSSGGLGGSAMTKLSDKMISGPPGASGAVTRNASGHRWALSPSAGSSLDEKARRTTSLLSFKERRQFDIARRAGVQGALGGRESGDTMVRRGDKKRMQEFQREKLREKYGLEKTNAILQAIQTQFDKFTKGS